MDINQRDDGQPMPLGPFDKTRDTVKDGLTIVDGKNAIGAEKISLCVNIHDNAIIDGLAMIETKP